MKSIYHSLIYPLTHSLIRLVERDEVNRSVTHSLFTHSLAHSFICKVVNLSLIHSLTHSLIHLFIHSIIHSFIRQVERDEVGQTPLIVVRLRLNPHDSSNNK